MGFQLKQFLIQLLEDNRGLVILLFCLPASFIFDLFVQLRQWLHRRYLEKSTHQERVEKIRKKVEEWKKQPKGQRKLLCTARPNWQSLSTTFFNKSACERIEIDLFEVLKLDEKNMLVEVEPNVTVREICQFLNPRGYTLAVTLEIGDATLGGLAFGVGMTTYSHKVGLYQETIEEYELVTGDAKVIRVRADNEHNDLFRCLPWSHGTLGFLVSLKLRIVPAKPYIHMKYIPCFSQNEYCDEMMRLSGALNKNEKVADFVEATIYDTDKAVIMLGKFADVDTWQKRLKVNDVCWWWKPWFYKHVEKFHPQGGEEYIPLQSYLLRHNRAIFWVLESMIPFGNHPIFRLFFGWLCPPKPAFLKFTTTNAVRNMTFTKQVFQDIVMPLGTLKDQVDTATRLFDAFPLLVYPCRIYDHRRGPQGQLRSPPEKYMVPDTNYAMFNDLGVYGTPGFVKRREKYNATYAMRSMEKFTRDVGGYSFLYADIFMTEDEFEEMFDLTLYNKVRTAYSCNGAFPTLYDKIKPEVDVIKIGNDTAKVD
ncbi:hypothetical protein WR25_11732 isoform A [Diploscapter pachys]|uniref:Delta(24)-sterol reductase n=1 Tax=Diploscapter pachys TaxID=2018661 RepID=A0A2A2KPH2_9BILA|nr:hypothetical protein WR25_11732 isoform A [Diploscapter pachys]